MSKRGWIIAVAFGLAFVAAITAGVWAISSLNQYYADQRQDIANRYNEEPHRGVEACREAIGVFAALECLIDAKAANQAENTAQKDLEAQQHMSMWALGVLVASTLTLLVTALGRSW